MQSYKTILMRQLVRRLIWTVALLDFKTLVSMFASSCSHIPCIAKYCSLDCITKNFTYYICCTYHINLKDFGEFLGQLINGQHAIVNQISN